MPLKYVVKAFYSSRDINKFVKTGNVAAATDGRRFRQINKHSKNFITVNELNQEERVFFHKKYILNNDRLDFIQVKENSDLNAKDELQSMR